MHAKLFILLVQEMQKLIKLVCFIYDIIPDVKASTVISIKNNVWKKSDRLVAWKCKYYPNFFNLKHTYINKIYWFGNLFIIKNKNLTFKTKVK